MKLIRKNGASIVATSAAFFVPSHTNKNVDLRNDRGFTSSLATYQNASIIMTSTPSDEKMNNTEA